MRAIGRTGSLLRPFLSQDHLLGQLARFGVLTLFSASITVGLPVLLHERFGMSPQAAAAIAFVIAFFFNFFSIRRLVFRSGNEAKRDLKVYLLSSVTFRLTEYLAFVLLTAIGIFYGIALVAVLIVSSITKFFWYRRVLHRSPKAAVP